MLFSATDKMRCGAPSVMRQRFEAPECVDANDCRVGSQRSVRDRAQRDAAVASLQFPQLRGTALELNESFLGRHRGCAGGDFGAARGRHDLQRLGRDFASNCDGASHCIRA